MKSLRKIRLYGTTDASGDLTVTASQDIHGWLWMVEWIDGDLTDGVDAVLSYDSADEGVNRTLLTLTDANDDAEYYPRELEDDNTGTALSTYTFAVINGAPKLVISSGGNAKTGGAIVHYLAG